MIAVTVNASARPGGDPGCGRWFDCGVAGGGCCSLGLYGGRPSSAVCRHLCDLGPRTPASAPAASVAEGGGGGGCGCSAPSVPVVRWLGVRWWGVPYPLRLWRDWLFLGYDRAGCGCLVKAKAALEGLAVVLGCARAAWRRFSKA